MFSSLFNSVHTCIAKCAGTDWYATGVILFEDVPWCGVYVPASFYSHARWSYRWRLRSLLLCLLSDECYLFPLFVDSVHLYEKFVLLIRTSRPSRIPILPHQIFRATFVSNQGPSARNQLPLPIRRSLSFQLFRFFFKTYLFS